MSFYIVCLTGFMMWAMPSLAKDQAEVSVGVQAPEAVRVGGDYKVEAINQLDAGAFRVEFRSLKPSGKFDVLYLDSDHVHVAVKAGQTLRLSAEILSSQGASAEVAQMVIFLPHSQGRIPVWLLSNKAPSGDLRGSKYLDMHSPVNDYMVM